MLRVVKKLKTEMLVNVLTKLLKVFPQVKDPLRPSHRTYRDRTFLSESGCKIWKELVMMKSVRNWPPQGVMAVRRISLYQNNEFVHMNALILTFSHPM